jgi:hypothetical protein
MQAHSSTFVDEKLYRFALFMSFIGHSSIIDTRQLDSRSQEIEVHTGLGAE